jgi:hypothetical protein
VLKNEIENYGCGFVLKIRTRENGDTLRLDISYVKEIRIVVVVVGPPRVTEGEEKQKKNQLVPHTPEIFSARDSKICGPPFLVSVVLSHRYRK